MGMMVHEMVQSQRDVAMHISKEGAHGEIDESLVFVSLRCFCGVDNISKKRNEVSGAGVNKGHVVVDVNGALVRTPCRSS
jgi:hypothetical protein